MILEFKKQYLSIDRFESVTIPKFVVLTGVNGSGKSHLLQAIASGHVALTGLPHVVTVLFNYETFKLENESPFNAHQLSNQRESAWTYYKQNVEPLVKKWHAPIEKKYEDIKHACQMRGASLWEMEDESVDGYRTFVKKFFSQTKMKNDENAQGILSLVKRLPYSLIDLQREEFVRLYRPFGFKSDFLPHQLGKIFWDYYVKYRGNQVNEFQNEKYGKKYEAVSENEFISIHGDKPWEIVNEILEKFDTLKYRITSPEGLDYFGSYHLKLQHKERKELNIEFSHLSSGERVLMALVACVYKQATDRHFPDVLLLDEVDGSLHPSMMKNMLEVVEDIFVKRGMTIILVSHSATTIALAPESSIYVMHPSGLNRIEKSSKQRALEILTQGFATIEQGLKLFDQIARSHINVMSEGHNVKIIEKALALHGVEGVEVISGIEGISGTKQLKVLFDFFCRVNHETVVVFVWDCDFKEELRAANNTYPFIFQMNEENLIARKGIENLFSEESLQGFTKKTIMSNGTEIIQFDEKRKRDFADVLCNRGSIEEFVNFKEFAEYIRKLEVE